MFNRRNFLQSLSALTASMMATPGSAGAQESDALGSLLPLRKLGQTGEWVTMLGLGGAHVADLYDERGAEEVIDAAIEGGIRFFDTAHMYGGGKSELRYGDYLVPKYREQVFIMTKAHLHSAKDVRNQLEQSLRRLKTDYIDLWQMHQVMSVDDADLRFSQGVVDEFVKAKEEGKVRYIGFTGHKDPAAHLRVLERTDVFQTCQMPMSCADPSYGSFIRNVLPELTARDMGVIAMKTLAAGGFFGGSTWFQGGSKPKLCPDRMSIEEALHFTWSMPVSVLITGPNNVEQLREKIEYARSFIGMSDAGREDLIARAADLTPESGVEFYKAQGLQTGIDWRCHG